MPVCHAHPPSLLIEENIAPKKYCICATMCYHLAGGYEAMINHWTVFEGMQNGRRSNRVRVTLNRQRTMVLNQVAFKGIGEPKAVELMFDSGRKLIGLRRCDPSKKNAFRIRPSKQGRHVSISLGSFLTHFQIKPTRTILFEEAMLDSSGFLTLDLTKTTVVSRGSR